MGESEEGDSKKDPDEKCDEKKTTKEEDQGKQKSESDRKDSTSSWNTTAPVFTPRSSTQPSTADTASKPNPTTPNVPTQANQTEKQSSTNNHPRPNNTNQPQQCPPSGMCQNGNRGQMCVYPGVQYAPYPVNQQMVPFNPNNGPVTYYQSCAPHGPGYAPPPNTMVNSGPPAQAGYSTNYIPQQVPQQGMTGYGPQVRQHGHPVPVQPYASNAPPVQQQYPIQNYQMQQRNNNATMMPGPTTPRNNGMIMPAAQHPQQGGNTYSTQNAKGQQKAQYGGPHVHQHANVAIQQAPVNYSQSEYHHYPQNQGYSNIQQQGRQICECGQENCNAPFSQENTTTVLELTAYGKKGRPIHKTMYQNHHAGSAPSQNNDYGHRGQQYQNWNDNQVQTQPGGNYSHPGRQNHLSQGSNNYPRPLMENQMQLVPNQQYHVKQIKPSHVSASSKTCHEIPPEVRQILPFPHAVDENIQFLLKLNGYHMNQIASLSEKLQSYEDRDCRLWDEKNDEERRPVERRPRPDRQDYHQSWKRQEPVETKVMIPQSSGHVVSDLLTPDSAASDNLVFEKVSIKDEKQSFETAKPSVTGSEKENEAKPEEQKNILKDPAILDVRNVVPKVETKTDSVAETAKTAEQSVESNIVKVENKNEDKDVISESKEVEAKESVKSSTSPTAQPTFTKKDESPKTNEPKTALPKDNVEKKKTTKPVASVIADSQDRSPKSETAPPRKSFAKVLSENMHVSSSKSNPTLDKKTSSAISVTTMTKLANKESSLPKKMSPVPEKKSTKIESNSLNTEKVSPGPKMGSLPKEAPSVSKTMSSVPEKVFPAPEKISAVPKNVSSELQKVSLVPRKSSQEQNKVLTGPEKKSPELKKSCSRPEKVSQEQKKVSGPEKKTSSSENVPSVSKKVSPVLEKQCQEPVNVSSRPEKVPPAPSKVSSVPRKMSQDTKKISPVPEKGSPGPKQVSKESKKVSPQSKQAFPAPEKESSKPEQASSVQKKRSPRLDCSNAKEKMSHPKTPKSSAGSAHVTDTKHNSTSNRKQSKEEPSTSNASEEKIAPEAEPKVKKVLKLNEEARTRLHQAIMKTLSGGQPIKEVLSNEDVYEDPDVALVYVPAMTVTDANHVLSNQDGNYEDDTSDGAGPSSNSGNADMKVEIANSSNGAFTVSHDSAFSRVSNEKEDTIEEVPPVIPLPANLVDDSASPEIADAPEADADVPEPEDVSEPEEVSEPTPDNTPGPSTSKKKKKSRNKKEETPTDEKQKETQDEALIRRFSLADLKKRNEASRSIKNAVGFYYRTIRRIRCVILSLKKARSSLHPLQEEIVHFWEQRMPGPIGFRRDLERCEDCVTERSSFYQDSGSFEFWQLHCFYQEVVKCINDDSIEAIVTADLMFVFREKLSNYNQQKMDEQYFAMVMSFGHWKPPFLPINICKPRDFEWSRIKLNPHPLKCFSNHINIQHLMTNDYDYRAEDLTDLDDHIATMFGEHCDIIVDWSPERTDTFIKAKIMVYEAMGNKTDLQQFYLHFFKFLVNIKSSVLDFDTYWYHYSMTTKKQEGEEFLLLSDLMYFRLLFGPEDKWDQ